MSAVHDLDRYVDLVVGEQATIVADFGDVGVDDPTGRLEWLRYSDTRPDEVIGQITVRDGRGAGRKLTAPAELMISKGPHR